MKCWQSPFWRALLVASILFGTLSTSASEDPPRKSSLSDLEEEILPFKPSSQRSDAELDRLHATALFAHGRMLYQRREFPQALQRYQRAWQHDSTITSIPAEVVKLALDLKRNDVAVRYAALAPAFPPSQISSFPRIAVLLSDNGKFSAAGRLYRQMIALRQESLTGSALLAIHLELGRLELLAGNYEESAVAFQYVARAIDDPTGHKLSEKDVQRVVSKPKIVASMIAESFLQSGRLDEAGDIFEAQQQQNPNDALHTYRLAKLAQKQGDLETANGKLAEYFESSSTEAGPGSYDLLKELLEGEFKNPARMTRFYIHRLEELHEASPTNRDLLSTLITELIADRQWARARVCCEQMLNERKSNVLYHQMMQAFHGLWKSGQDDPQTVDILVRLLSKLAGKTGDMSGPLMEEIARDKTLVNRMLSLVTPMLEDPDQFEERPPEQPGRSLAGRIVTARVDAAIAVGSLAIASQQADKAAPLFEFAIAQQPGQQARSLEIWALQLLIADEMERAVEILEKAVGNDQVRPKQGFYFFLASAAEMAGNTERGLEAARQAAALSPDNARIQSRLGWVYYHAGRYPEAEQQYLALIEKFDGQFDSASTRDVVRETRMLLSNICVRQKRLPEAEEWLEQVLDEFPENVGAYNDLGYLWVDQDKRLQRAQRMIEVAVKTEPDNAAYRDSLGWACYRLGQFEKAIKHLLHAAKNSEQDGVIFDHLGDAYFANGQAGKARESWKKALKLFAPDEQEMRTSVMEKLGKKSATTSESP